MVNHLMIAFDDLFQYKDFVQSSGKWGYSPFGIELALPNFARLEARSTNFRRASAIVASCEPSRAAILSGFSPAESGIFTVGQPWQNTLDPHQLWPYQVRRAGYWMGTTGKIFHGYVPQPQDVYEVLYDSEPFQVVWNPSGEATEWGGLYGRGWDNETDWYDSYRANDTINFLQNIAPTLDKPWQFECGFHHPHNAWDAPNRIFESLDLNDIIMPADWPLSWDLLPYADQFMGMGKQLGTSSPSTWDAEQIDWWKKTVRNYCAAVIWADEKLGDVLDALDSSPFNDDILITCWSDHGYHLGDKGVWHKFSLWEEACNAPLLISAPGQTVARTVWDPVSLVDLGPTICDYLGVGYAEERHGVSLRPLVEGGTMPARLIPSYHYGSVSGALGEYRITAYADGSTEYYNVMTDPWLKENLAEIGPGYAEALEELHQVSRDWGMQLVEEGMSIKPGTPFASYLGWTPTVDTITGSFIVIGDMEVRAKSPGYTKMWSQHVGNRPAGQGKVIMPPGVEELELTDNSAGGTIVGNSLNNKVIVWYGKDRTIHLGDGDDLIGARRDGGSISSGRIIAYGGRGNDTIHGSDAANWQDPHDSLFGGEGDDLLYGYGGNDLIVGGAGNDTMDGGTGNDTIVADARTDSVIGGGGADRIEVTGGRNHVISGGADGDTFVINRTGASHTITDLSSADTLDLSDWSAIQPVAVVQAGSDVIVSAALERIVCQNTTVATVRSVITGATYA